LKFSSCVSFALQATSGLGDGGIIYILSPERQPIKELKYRISTKVHQRIFSPELLVNSKQKADEMHVSPAIAKPTVTGSFKVQALQYFPLSKYSKAINIYNFTFPKAYFQT